MRICVLVLSWSQPSISLTGPLRSRERCWVERACVGGESNSCNPAPRTAAGIESTHPGNHRRAKIARSMIAHVIAHTDGVRLLRLSLPLSLLCSPDFSVPREWGKKRWRIYRENPRFALSVPSSLRDLFSPRAVSRHPGVSARSGLSSDGTMRFCVSPIYRTI